MSATSLDIGESIVITIVIFAYYLIITFIRYLLILSYKLEVGIRFDTLISQNNVNSYGTEQPAQRIKTSFYDEYGRRFPVA